ncbi:MAG: DUF6602 domain-containing protein [Pseudonocardiaceae bacterium]
MIRTVAELLSDIIRDELPLLDTSEIRHAPTIGDMYKGLSADLLGRAIPEGLGLKVVTGFATNGDGNLSGQFDCMLVHGEGKPVPYTDAFVWHVKDIIAVIDVKKTLHGPEMADALEQLRSVKTLESNYRSISAADSPDEPVDIKPALTAFAETTRRVAPRYEDLGDLSVEEQMIFHALVIEQTSIIRIVLGLHGIKSELAFRKALVELLRANIGINDYSPGCFPQLIISGSYSLAKANGRPYSTRFVNRELSSVPTMEPWSPAFVTLEESVILQRLCAGTNVRMDDTELLKWLQERDVEPEVLRDNLLETGLVEIKDQELQLITRDCLCAILPSGEYAAAENNTGRLTRWIAKQRASASNPE